MSKIMNLGVILSLLVLNQAYGKQGEAPKLSPELLKAGKAVYTKSCAECHGAGGLGDGESSQYFDKKPTNFVTDKFKKGDSPKDIYKTVHDGIPEAQMPAASDLSDKELWAVSYYVLSFKKK